MSNRSALRLVTPLHGAPVSLVQVVRRHGGYLVCTPCLAVQAGGPEAWVVLQGATR